MYGALYAFAFLVTRTRKVGRPTNFRRMPDGTSIDGLTKLRDGTWRISGSEQTTFTEANEEWAARRAMDLMEKRKGKDLIDLPLG